MDISKQLKNAMSKPAPDEKYFAAKYPKSVEADMKTKDKKQSDKIKILNWMKQGKRINKFIAWELFYCGVLAQRIADLKKEGYPIKDRRMKEIQGCPSEYWMEA